MPRKTRRKILGERAQYEQEAREEGLRDLLRELRYAWRRRKDATEVAEQDEPSNHND